MDGTQEVQNISNLDTFSEMFSNFPIQTQVGIGLMAVVWLIGGNVLLYFSMKRRSIPYWKILIPFSGTIFGFNTKEWFILALLAVTALLFGMWGISYQ